MKSPKSLVEVSSSLPYAWQNKFSNETTLSRRHPNISLEMVPVLEEDSTNCLKWIWPCSCFAHLITVQVVKDALHMYKWTCQTVSASSMNNVHMQYANQNEPSLTVHLFNLYYETTMSVCLSVCLLFVTNWHSAKSAIWFCNLLGTGNFTERGQTRSYYRRMMASVCLCSMWYSAGLAIVRLCVWILPVAATYQCQLSVPSLRGQLMSTSKSWEVNGHYTMH